MKLVTAKFVFQKPRSTDVVTVEFEGDVIAVTDGSNRRELDNKPARRGGRPRKPRVTDCLSAIEEARRPESPPVDETEKRKQQRQKRTRVKPNLKVFGSG